MSNVLLKGKISPLIDPWRMLICLLLTQLFVAFIGRSIGPLGPIAWVSTISDEGELNLAPFSFFTVASRNPPMLCISVGPGVGEREGTMKDTLVNIRTQKEFVINVVPSFLGNEMEKSSENFPSAVNEFEAAGITPIDSHIIKPKRVKEAPIQMECQLEQIIVLGSDHLIIGKMVRYHIFVKKVYF